MQNREKLTNEIKNYLSETKTSFNLYKPFNFIKYIEINKKIEFLNCKDFHDYKSFVLFIDWKNYEFRKLKNERLLLLLKNKNLNEGTYLFLCNYLKGIVNWMN